MSNERFTQGEWHVQIEQPYPHTQSQILTVITNNFDVVCVPHGIRNQHDAHLISAAPKMYRALRDVADEIYHDDGDDYYTINLTQEEVDAIRAALAKADGVVRDE